MIIWLMSHTSYSLTMNCTKGEMKKHTRIHAHSRTELDKLEFLVGTVSAIWLRIKSDYSLVSDFPLAMRLQRMSAKRRRKPQLVARREKRKVKRSYFGRGNRMEICRVL